MSAFSEAAVRLRDGYRRNGPVNCRSPRTRRRQLYAQSGRAAIRVNGASDFSAEEVAFDAAPERMT
jgi:hypothetical protein